MAKKTYYITTAIDYPNGKPHIGHAFEKIIADVCARWKRVNSYDVFFLTGTDENGQKLQEAAETAGLEPQAFVDQMAEKFKEFAKELEISNDFFIRTTAPYHKKKATEIFNKVLEKGDIYKGLYQGWHCVPCETYYTEKNLENSNCPKCGRPVKVIEEEAYFFKLSKYNNQLLKHIKKNKKFIFPEFRRNEILHRLENDELKDLCVSRSTIKWGIPLPNDPDHVIYVWFDALINYISGLGNKEAQFWPANVHVIGKDITWFHTVIWPCMLFAADIELPNQVYVHGFINDKNGEKMSKSKGNVVEPLEIINKYSADVLKYYFLRSTPAGQDGNFSEEDLVERYNTELANELGNLVTRSAVLVEKYFNGKVPKARPDKIFNTKKLLKELNANMEHFDFNIALENIWRTIKQINKYINEKEPWKEEDKKKLSKVVYTVVDSIRLINILLQAFMPHTSAKICKQYKFNQETIEQFIWGLLEPNTEITKGEILFPKTELNSKPVFPLNLKVGEITGAEEHPGADKLLILKVNIGNEIQLIAGIKEWYKPAELIGKKIIVVSNLKSAKLRGKQSEGMLLAAEKEGKVVLLNCDVPSGSSIEVEGFNNETKQIEFSDFLKVILEVKDKKVYYSGKQLKSNKSEVIAEIGDGAKIR